MAAGDESAPGSIGMNKASKRGKTKVAALTDSSQGKFYCNMMNSSKFKKPGQASSPDSSPFRFLREPVKLRAHNDRKALGGGRVNQQFSMATPSLNDSDIKGLISRYPVKQQAITLDSRQSPRESK